MTSIVTDYLPLEIKSNPYYVHAKRGYLSHLLLDAAKDGQNVYENEYNKLNNLAYARKGNERLGFISTLHTFGRDIKFNPHIHTLIAECTIEKNRKKKPYRFVNRIIAYNNDFEDLKDLFIIGLFLLLFRYLFIFSSIYFK